MTLLSALFALTVPSFAGGVGDCEGVWPDDPSPSASMTAACVGEWLDTAYGGQPDLEMDPSYGWINIPLFTAEQYTRMASHARSSCTPGEAIQPCERAAEFFEGCARLRFETFDPTVMMSFDSALAKIAAGQQLVAPDLEPGGMKWSAHTLWRLRNAVFARHGRPFNNPDLHRFYYTAGAVSGSSVLPFQVDPNYNDAMLTDIDRANVELILKLE